MPNGMLLGFGMVQVKQEGTPVHPYDLSYSSDKVFDKQVKGYIEYWQNRGRDMSLDICWEDYQRINNEG